MMWSPLLKVVEFDFGEAQTRSRRTWMIEASYLLFQLARGQRPEPRQLIPRAVVSLAKRRRQKAVKA